MGLDGIERIIKKSVPSVLYRIREITLITGLGRELRMRRRGRDGMT